MDLGKFISISEQGVSQRFCQFHNGKNRKDFLWLRPVELPVRTKIFIYSLARLSQSFNYQTMVPSLTGQDHHPALFTSELSRIIFLNLEENMFSLS